MIKNIKIINNAGHQTYWNLFDDLETYTFLKPAFVAHISSSHRYSKQYTPTSKAPCGIFNTLLCLVWMPNWKVLSLRYMANSSIDYLLSKFCQIVLLFSTVFWDCQMLDSFWSNILICSSMYRKGLHFFTEPWLFSEVWTKPFSSHPTYVHVCS